MNSENKILAALGAVLAGALAFVLLRGKTETPPGAETEVRGFTVSIR